MFSLKHLRKLALALSSGLAALGLALGAAAPALAQQATPAAPDPERRDERLARLFEREQNWLEAQADHLARAAEAVDKTQAFIEKAQAEGKDTSGLEAALDDFRSRLAEAQAAHQAAEAILAAHPGFDDAGAVTDPQLARQTVVDAGYELREAHFQLRQGERDLRHALREFRRANRPTPVAAPQL